MKEKNQKRARNRADRLIKNRYPLLTKRQIEEAIQSGLVKRLNGKRFVKGDSFENHEQIDYSELECHIQKLSCGNAEINVEIALEEDDFLAIDKPAGMPSHPLSLHDFNTATHWALAHYPLLKKEFPEIQPKISPHRLDTGTSGILVLTKTQQAYRNWRELFENKKLTKKYLVWCWGKPSQNHFNIELPIAHHWQDRRKMVVIRDVLDRHREPVVSAKSYVQIKEIHQKKGVFLAEVTSCTGVTHQIRVHLAAMGYPLVGDDLYDSEFERRPLREKYHLLRATEILGTSYLLRVPADGFYSLFSSSVGSS